LGVRGEVIDDGAEAGRPKGWQDRVLRNIPVRGKFSFHVALRMIKDVPYRKTRGRRGGGQLEEEFRRKGKVLPT
jgi:hypothetical protein